VDVNQGELDALIVRGYLAEHERGAPQLKRRNVSERRSLTVCCRNAAIRLRWEQ
jgi:hypothetical protein